LTKDEVVERLAVGMDVYHKAAAISAVAAVAPANYRVFTIIANELSDGISFDFWQRR
jgi:hypothetical protein